MVNGQDQKERSRSPNPKSKRSAFSKTSKLVGTVNILQISAHRTFKKDLEKGPPQKSLIRDFSEVLEEDAKVHEGLIGGWQQDGKL